MKITSYMARCGLAVLAATLGLFGQAALAQQAQASYTGEKACIECHGQET